MEEPKWVVTNEFLKCKGCGKEGVWLVRNRVKEMQASGELPEDWFAGNILKVEYENKRKARKVGDKIPMVLYIEDYCGHCGYRQLVTVMEIEVSVVASLPDIASKIAVPRPFNPFDIKGMRDRQRD